MPDTGFTYGSSTRGYGGKNGTKERILGGNRWLTGDMASAHVVIAKKTENYSKYIECCMEICDSLNLDNHGAWLRRYTRKKNHKSEKKTPP
jgi:hypothetical protein